MHGSINVMPTPVDISGYLRELERSMTEAALRQLALEQPLIPASFPMERRWYVVYCNIKCEFRAQMGLKSKGFETFLPYIRKRIRHGRVTTIANRPVFPRYLFVKFDVEKDEWFHPIKTTDGVEDLIRNQNIPVRIADRDLSRIMLMQSNGDFDLTGKTVRSDYQPGEQVRISEGVFSGFNARVVAAMPDKNRAELMLEFLGRKSKIELDYDALQKL
jgi:transcriptional antiterminator RfaH